MEWNDLIVRVSANIHYWSYYVSRKSPLEKDDAYQELTIILWKQYCSNQEKNKKITVYYMQKRLEYGAFRLIKKAYSSFPETSEFNDEVYYENRERDLFYSNFVNEIFDEVKNILRNDKEIKALDILIMILEGKKNKEIAEEMDIKANTLSLYIKRKIKSQLKKIVEKQKEDVWKKKELSP